MKVLFVVSGNNKHFDVAPFIESQRLSLNPFGIRVSYYRIEDTGLKGYLKHLFPLRKHIRNNHFDIVHSHYSLSGWLSALTFTRIPKIVSYMGSDLHSNRKERKLINSNIVNILSANFLLLFVKRAIVKSHSLNEKIILRNKVEIIPNGVDIDRFYPLNQKKAKHLLGLKNNDNYVLFLGDPRQKNKNIQLLKDSLTLVDNKTNLLIPYPVIPSEVPKYLNACNMLVLTSLNEGSPNVIKEAMACNVPIVSTNVGDTEWVMSHTNGCFITTFEPKDVAEKIVQANQFSAMTGRTRGRDRILELGLDTESIAKKIADLYKKMM